MNKEKIAIVAGVGQGLGSAVCMELCAAGYHVVPLARSNKVTDELLLKAEQNGYKLTPIHCDLTEPDSITAAATKMKQLTGQITVYIHNAGEFVMDDYLHLSAEAFERVWRITCYSAFQLSQLLIPEMLKHREGVILFTGATASIRGGVKFAAFASAKFALRGLAQSLAREFGPQGIHVAHILLDGIIYCDWTVERFGVEKAKAMSAEDIAKNYRNLIEQPASTWTQELDLRPFNEKY